MINRIVEQMFYKGIAIGVISLALSSSQLVRADQNECEKLITVDTNVDGLLLTRQEKIKLLDDRYYEALTAYSECLRGDHSSSSALRGGSGAGGGIQGTEAPSSGGAAGGASAAVDAAGGDQTLGGGGEQQPITNGKPPDDIPPADNDDALALQLRRAAENESDPEVQERLWNEYRRYKGIPIPRDDSADTSSDTTQNQQPNIERAPTNQLNSDQLDAAVAVVLASNYAESSQGSGFVVAPGKLITNEHVVAGKPQVWLEFGDGKKVRGDVTRTVKQRDVALVQFDSRLRRPILPIRQYPAQRGEEVYSFGAPRGISGTLTRGIVSAVRADSQGQGYIQSDVTISPGSSGGPLLDSKFSVIGVAVEGVMMSGTPEGLNFFIPIKEGMQALGL